MNTDKEKDYADDAIKKVDDNIWLETSIKLAIKFCSWYIGRY